MIDQIDRVENGAQRELHAAFRRNLERSLGPAFDPACMVRLLFHGTRAEAAQSIIRSETGGFLPLLAGTVTGAMWGDGTYFARDAAYSDRYAAQLAGGQRQMLIAEARTGVEVCVEEGRGRRKERSLGQFGRSDGIQKRHASCPSRRHTQPSSTFAI